MFSAVTRTRSAIARRPLHRHPAVLAVTLAFVSTGLTEVQASISVIGNSVYNAVTNSHTYTYSIQNMSLTQDAVIVTLNVDRAAAIIGLSSPMGFSLTYDPFVNVVNFTEDADISTPQSFGPGMTIGTFSFTSPVGPGMASYSAFDSAGSEFMGLVTAPIPEPATAGLGILGGLLVGFRRRRSEAPGATIV
jgi:hypothetical protein